MSSVHSEKAPSPKLNPVQLHLLELFAGNLTEEDLQEIKMLLVQYYSLKVDEELDQIWSKRQYTTETFQEATQNLHLRAKK
ncbi:MAG: hypothetical protein KBG02_16620 [Haliscomenobacter sp.]|nr:hypothetical protein [Haliscomenobacter sp.]MBK8654504.1 hypothetical protein [Haliscomenobacter sp.]MBP9078495.1 hypothetical protein [Haliscomenobacter sp.]